MPQPQPVVRPLPLSALLLLLCGALWLSLSRVQAPSSYIASAVAIALLTVAFAVLTFRRKPQWTLFSVLFFSLGHEITKDWFVSREVYQQQWIWLFMQWLSVALLTFVLTALCWAVACHLLAAKRRAA